MVAELTVASFFTPSWEYPGHAARLRSECERLGLPHRIEERPDTGSYLGNTRHKPFFLLETMRELEKPLLWIDVDGSILRRPELLRGDLDFMARPQPERKERTWHVGTLYFNATPPAFELLEAWAAATGTGSDEAAFDRVWNALDWSGRWAPLPETYFEILQGGRRRPGPDTVICHRLSGSPAKRRMKERNRRGS